MTKLFYSFSEALEPGWCSDGLEIACWNGDLVSSTFRAQNALPTGVDPSPNTIAERLPKRGQLQYGRWAALILKMLKDRNERAHAAQLKHGAAE